MKKCCLKSMNPIGLLGISNVVDLPQPVDQDREQSWHRCQIWPGLSVLMPASPWESSRYCLLHRKRLVESGRVGRSCADTTALQCQPGPLPLCLYCLCTLLYYYYYYLNKYYFPLKHNLLVLVLRCPGIPDCSVGRCVVYVCITTVQPQ